jgi:hypothetical protein
MFGEIKEIAAGSGDPSLSVTVRTSSLIHVEGIML